MEVFERPDDQSVRVHGLNLLLRAVVLGAGLVLPAAAMAQGTPRSVGLLPVADNSIFLNIGSPGLLRSNGAGSIFTGRTAPTANIIQRGLVRFDVSEIPCGARVTAVSLHMTLVRAGGGGGGGSPAVTLHRLLSPWGEGASSSYGGRGAPSTAGDANWLERFSPGTLWTTPGGDFVPLASAVTGIGETPAVEWSSGPGLIADVTGWLADAATNHGWILINDEVNSSTARKLASREYPEVESRPTLRITFVPPCLADLPLPGTGCRDGVVDGSDFIAFINSFTTGEPAVDAAADVAGGGADGLSPDGLIDGSDFVAFVNAFSAGC